MLRFNSDNNDTGKIEKTIAKYENKFEVVKYRNRRGAVGCGLVIR